MDKSKLTIVGGFPKEKDKVYGGIVTSCEILLESSLVKEFDVILVDSTQKSNPPPKFFKRFRLALIRLIKYLFVLIFNRPEVVLIFASGGFSFVEKGVMAFFAKCLNIPVILFPRGGRLIDEALSSKLYLKLIKWASSQSTYFLCQGQNWYNFATQTLGKDPNQLRIIPNWSATPSYLKLGSSRKYRKLKDHVNLLFVGWLEKEKGIFDLIQAISLLPDNIDYKLTIAGMGSAEYEVRQAVLKLGISKKVSFSGWLSKNEKYLAFKEADIYILPSWIEGMPNSLIEAMASGIPVISTDVGNIPYYLSHYEDSILVRPHNYNEIYEALSVLIHNPDLSETIGKKGNFSANKNFSSEKSIMKMIELIKNC